MFQNQNQELKNTTKTNIKENDNDFFFQESLQKLCTFKLNIRPT